MNTFSTRFLGGIAILCLITLPSLSAARSADIDELEGMRAVGTARMQVLFWKVYDATLLAPQGEFQSEEPFALSLTYLRKLDGEKIAARSIEEMRKQGLDDEERLGRWYDLLANIIPDVNARDEIVGLAAEDGSTRFFLHGEPIGSVDEPGFTDAFFAIWLGEQTSEPELRNQLLGVQ
ncbi:MAG: chalcone isomerase family protein [Pseudomonadota bacterium]